jgi:hypothetical protein
MSIFAHRDVSCEFSTLRGHLSGSALSSPGIGRVDELLDLVEVTRRFRAPPGGRKILAQALDGLDKAMLIWRTKSPTPMRKMR